MMIFIRVTKIETGFFAVLWKLICSVACCLCCMHVSGQYIRDSITWESKSESVNFVARGTTIVNLPESEEYIIRNQNTESRTSKPFVYIAKGATIVNFSASENYDIINLNVKTESNDVSSKQSSVKKTEKQISKAPQKSITKKQSLPQNRNIVFENIPSKDTYEKSLKFRTNLIVPTNHQPDSKNTILNSVFTTFVCTYSEDKIIEALIPWKRFSDFESSFARPPPM